MSLVDYIFQRLLKANCTSFVNENGDTEYICTEDGNARCSASHTLPNTGAMTFSNINHRGETSVEDAMVEFYRNSLAAEDPMVADAIICGSGLTIPPHLKLRVLAWPYDKWFLFNSKTGLLSDKWWHIYGHFPI